MKKTILSIIFAVLTFMALRPIIKNINYYATLAEVTCVDYEKDEVTFTTWNGFDYIWGGVDEWSVGDFASLCMNDIGTDFVTDDEIVSVRYERIDFDSPYRNIDIAKKLQKGM